MKELSLLKLPAPLKRDALLWKKLGHRLSLLHVKDGSLWIPEQYALRLGCTSLEKFGPEAVIAREGAPVLWGIRWAPVEDATIWSGILQRYEKVLLSKLRAKDRAKSLPERIVEAVVQDSFSFA